MDYTNAIVSYGVPMIILAAIGIFVYRSGWPFMQEQIRASQQERKEQAAEFMKALERRDAQNAAQNAAIIATLQELVNSVRELKADKEREREKGK